MMSYWTYGCTSILTAAAETTYRQDEWAIYEVCPAHTLGQDDGEHIQGWCHSLYHISLLIVTKQLSVQIWPGLPLPQGMVHALTAIAAETWCRDPRPQESWHGDSAVRWERPGTQAAQIQCQLCDPRSAQIISLTKIEHKSHLTIFKQCGKIKIYLFTVYCLRLDYSATAWRLKPCEWLISCHYYTI